jgi:hypothetical protein
MEPKVIKIEIKVTRTMATVLVGLLLVALALLAVTSAGAHPPLEGPGGQGEATVTSSVPTMISFQGQLLDSGGNPVPTGTYSMTFRLYNNMPIGGTAFWTETHSSVQVTDGLFNVLLGGSGNPLDPSAFTGTTYLGVTVGSDPEMTPRQQMVSVPYAFVAGTDNDWDGAGTGTMYPHHLTDNVGIGTIPRNKLDVAGGVTVLGEYWAGSVPAPADGMIISGTVAMGHYPNGDPVGPYEALRVLQADPSTPIFGAYNQAGNLMFQIAGGVNPHAGLVKVGGVNTAVDLLVGDSTISGKIGVGTSSPQSALQVEGNPGYLQIDSYNGTPPAYDCYPETIGRMILDFANNRLYVCTGAGGWKYAVLQ